MHTDRRRSLLLLAFVLLLAFAVRVYRLDDQPLWCDEGLNAYYGHLDPLTMGQQVAINHDTDPPAHRITLSIWMLAAGSSPFSMRYLSVLMGILAVLLTYALGVWLTDKRVATLAAILMAAAPMQVHFTREAKGYPFALVFALASTYVWGKKLGYVRINRSTRSNGIGWWIIYIGCIVATVGTHFYLAPLILWQGLWVLVSTLKTVRNDPAERDRALGWLKRWLIAAMIGGLILLPWVIFVVPASFAGAVGASKSGSQSPWLFMVELVRTFGAGPVGKGPAALAVSLILMALATIGMISGRQRPFFLSRIGVPIVIAFFIQVLLSFFAPRFLLYVGPIYYLLVSQGMEVFRAWRRWIPLTLAILMLGLWSPILYTEYHPDLDPLEDPRPFIERIRALSVPGDAVAYGYIWQKGYLQSYQPQTDLDYYLAHYTPDSVGSGLSEIFETHSRLWLLDYRVSSTNPQNLAGSWLENRAYTVEANWYGNHYLSLFLGPDYHTPGVGPKQETGIFEEKMELRYPIVNSRLAPGDILALPLQWRSLTALDENFKAFVHVSKPRVPPIAQSDAPPENRFRPTSSWEAGTVIVDRRALLLPETIEAGLYQITVGLYRPSDGKRLLVTGSHNQDQLVLGNLEIIK